MTYANISKPAPLFEQILLAMTTILCIALFYHVDIYKYWYEERAKRNFDFFLEQRVADVSEEQIKEEAWGNAFVVCNQVVQYFQANKIKDPLVLLEPNEYVRTAVGFKMPEPVIFYYFTQGKVKAVLTNSSNVDKAQYILRLNKGAATIQAIRSPQELAGILKTYQPYKQEQ